jgi:hypothetical protein
MQKQHPITKNEHLTDMRAMLLTLFALTLPALADVPSPKQPIPVRAVRDPFLSLQQKGHQKGSWYLSAEGHAVFCYGPTMYVQGSNGDLIRVATFCRGDRVIVPLHE